MRPFLAHTGKEGNFSDAQPLNEHLRAVARKARDLATADFPEYPALAELAFVAGMLHDLGKYRPEFQDHIRSLPVQREKTYHKEAGAARAKKNTPIALAILGHHGGIPDFSALNASVQGQNGEAVASQVQAVAAADLPDLANLQIPPFAERDWLKGELLTRLLFSVLVDADWADTSAFHRRVKKLAPEPAPAPFTPDVWISRLESFISARAAHCRDANVKAVRAGVLAACTKAAEFPPDVFSLTVPTGGGKTLSGLAFALRHAMRYGLRRIIYVAPFLTILEQNTDVIRKALGLSEDDPALFTHHSLAILPAAPDEQDLGSGAAARRAENWDAPLVVTTNVQFFESLFSNRPSSCRKLHNIARSVVLLDECQALPPGLAAPTCAMLRQFAETLRTSIVLCTATQPAFSHPELKAQERLDPRKIIEDEADLFQRLRRVDLHWPTSRDDKLTWPQVAAQMRGEPAALCVVNTRRAARELFAELKQVCPEGTAFHLSTTMCPAHRAKVLNRVRCFLLSKQPCYLVSTQLIEAGVDVDFPFAMREMAPLEAIIQAAGRCNRERLLPADGRVVVFRSEEGALPDRRGWYGAGVNVVETDFLACGRLPDVSRPQDIQDYFTRLYHTGDLDQHDIQKLRGNLNFRQVAEAYRLISDDTFSVVVSTWEGHREEVAALVSAACTNRSRADFRRLALFQVNLRNYEKARVAHCLAEAGPDLALMLWSGVYDSELGVTLEDAGLEDLPVL